ncbi:MAG: hypothetical protein HYS12_27980 [Planctomycetes bacterium]|nr:hypothetical protein [Planctomycetota bacterium]
MPTITRDRAVELLTNAVETSPPDDLVEIYNELFPADPTTRDVANKNPQPISQKVLEHIRHGLEIEEILDLWNVIFPRRRHFRFEEEDELFYYDEEREPVWEEE